VDWPASPLGQALAALNVDSVVQPAHPHGAFAMVVWQVVGYPAEDARQAAGMKALIETVGLDAAAIRAASDDTLRSVARAGGSIAVDLRAERLRTVAGKVLDEFGGDLDQVLTWPIAKARKALSGFPMVGAPVADKILLFCGAAAILAPESNALRVLIRLRLVPAEGGYSRQYRAANALAAEQLPADVALLQRAHLVLRRHGLSVCRRGGPMLADCPLAGTCRDRGGPNG
jgi:endonuclease III